MSKQENDDDKTLRGDDKSSLTSMVGTARSLLKSTVHSAVVSTNQFLSTLEHTADSVTEAVRGPTAAGLEQATAFTKQAVAVYDRRYEYGPYLVGGTGVLTGGVVALRRGRVPGALAGLLAGGLAYAVVYVPLEDVVGLDSSSSLDRTSSRRDGGSSS